MTTELTTMPTPSDVITAKEAKIKSGDMPVLRRTPEELAEEQKACEIIVQETLGSSAMLVPEDLRKDPKALLTLVAYSRDMGFSHWEVLQNAFVIKGKLAFNTKFLVSVLGNRYNMQPRYQWHNGRESVTVTFVDTTRVDANGDYMPIKNVSFMLTMQEGLASAQPNSQVWKTQPQKMLCYRAVKMAIDTHFPGIMSGALWGEREEFIEFANAENYIPKDTNAKQIKIIRNEVNQEMRSVAFPQITKEVKQPEIKASATKETKQPAKEIINEPLLESPETFSVFNHLKNAIQKAGSQDELKALQKVIKENVDTGEIIPDERAELLDLFNAKKEQLK
jgi:hypothetical protein